MNENTFKTVTSTGILNLVLGILALAGGLVTGILLLVSGARLLKIKSKVMI
jgi:hypothetical protein